MKRGEVARLLPRATELRAEAVLDVVRFAAESGLGLRGVTASPLPGPSGNVEFFLWLRHGAATLICATRLSANS